MKLEGKVALITGASKGIGRAIALGLAREGADILMNFHTDREGADQTAKQIRALGRKATVLQADIGDVSAVSEMFQQVRAHSQRLDVLVNNAAITGWTDLFAVTEAQYDRIMATNLKGTFFCSVEAARIMREDGGGSIINISTNCAALAVKNLTIYAASKGGVHALTKQLAVELAPYHIRVNTFAPGPTQMERNLEDDPDYDRTWGQMVPMKRTALPEEMIGPAVFLASSDSSYMTGQVFFVDGGWTVQGKIPEAHMDHVMERNRS